MVSVMPEMPWLWMYWAVFTARPWFRGYSCTRRTIDGCGDSPPVDGLLDVLDVRLDELLDVLELDEELVTVACPSVVEDVVTAPHAGPEPGEPDKGARTQVSGLQSGGPEPRFRGSDGLLIRSNAERGDKYNSIVLSFANNLRYYLPITTKFLIRPSC